MSVNIMVIGNQSYAGTNKYKGHILEEDSNRIWLACGSAFNTRDDWQCVSHDPRDVGCLKCKKILDRRSRRVASSKNERAAWMDTQAVAPNTRTLRSTVVDTPQATL